MAIVRVGGGGSLARIPNSGPPAKAAKHAVKYAAKKHAAKKHAAKHPAKHALKHAAKHAAKAAKHAAKHASPGLPDAPYLVREESTQDELELSRAFHHLQRAGAVISLLEADTGGDLRALLEDGIDLYRGAHARKHTISARCATGLLRAAEHLGMAGLYAARREHRVEVEPPPRGAIAAHLETLGARLGGAGKTARGKRLVALARELLRRAGAAGDDPHLEYELTMAADGICTALEAGL